MRGGDRVVWFDHDWLAVTLFQREARLEPLLRPDRGESSLHGDAAAGRALHLHPNTVRYRIERWEQLTGWDVKTRHGLIRSIAALGLARPPDG